VHPKPNTLFQTNPARRHSQTVTIKNVADRLIKILEQLDLEPPYLLVGHSLGGVYVRGFAVYYPEMLAGLVIVDPGDFTETQQNKLITMKFSGGVSKE
jgi:pimeloyl-ACP methyl ester carboxylesterase